MRRITVLLTMILVLCAASVSFFGYAAQGDGYSDHVTVCTGNGLFVMRYEGTRWHIERVIPDPFSDDLTLQYPVSSAAICGDTAAVLCDDSDGDQLILYTYDVHTGVMDSLVIPRYTGGYHRGFYYDGSTLLIQDDDRPSLIHRYSSGGRFLGSDDLQGGQVSLFCGWTGGLYVLCDSRLYRFIGSGYQTIGGAELHAPASFVAENVLADSAGTLYRVEGDRLSSMLHIANGGFCTAVTLYEGSVYAADGNTIFRYDPDTGRRTAYFDADMPVAALYSSGAYLYAVSEGASVLRVSPDSFSPCPDDPTSVHSGPISSDVYRIDPVNYRITRIPSVTTFAQLKANIHFDGYQAQLYRGGKNIRTGSVGTAMTLVFSGADDAYTYELSVIGDITGEGNVNSRDVGELMDYFLGNLQFDGVYTDAADISDDGLVDMLDLAMLCRAAG